MIKNFSKKTYMLFMLATLPIAMPFDVLGKQTIPELIQELETAQTPDLQNILVSIDSHPDRRKTLPTLKVTDRAKAILVHHMLKSLFIGDNNNSATTCFSNFVDLDGTLKDGTSAKKVTIDQFFDAYHSCIIEESESTEKSEVQD